MRIAINKSRTNIKKYLCLITNNPTRYWHQYTVVAPEADQTRHTLVHQCQ
jgi:hypothetical protein